jgi:hypothetical protein
LAGFDKKITSRVCRAVVEKPAGISQGNLTSCNHTLIEKISAGFGENFPIVPWLKKFERDRDRD